MSPTKIIDWNGIIHYADPADPSVSLCPDHICLCGADMINPASNTPVTCADCRTTKEN